MPSSRLAQSPEQGAPRSSQAMGQQRGSAGGATSAGFSSPALQPEAAGPAQRLSSIWGGAREQPREASSSGAQQWAGTSRRPESQASPSQPQQPASTSDPSSMWAALQALQPDAAPPSPPAAGLPSQSDLWSSLVIPVQPPPPPPPPQGSPADPRQALLAQGGTPLEKGAPAGSRLLSYTSGAESTPRASSSNLASWQGSLDGSVTSAAAAQVICLKSTLPEHCIVCSYDMRKWLLAGAFMPDLRAPCKVAAGMWRPGARAPGLAATARRSRRACTAWSATISCLRSCPAAARCPLWSPPRSLRPSQVPVQAVPVHACTGRVLQLAVQTACLKAVRPAAGESLC
jgi:hypothetical protein